MSRQSNELTCPAGDPDCTESEPCQECDWLALGMICEYVLCHYAPEVIQDEVVSAAHPGREPLSTESGMGL